MRLEAKGAHKVIIKRQKKRFLELITGDAPKWIVSAARLCCRLWAWD